MTIEDDDVVERQEKHDRYLDCLGTLMLGCRGHWKDQTAGHFREYLSSAHELAVSAVYRDDQSALQIVVDAEKVIAAHEMKALQQRGGELQ